MQAKTDFAYVLADAGKMLPSVGKKLPAPFFTDGSCERICIGLGARAKPNCAGKISCGHFWYILTTRGQKYMFLPFAGKKVPTRSKCCHSVVKTNDFADCFADAGKKMSTKAASNRARSCVGEKYLRV